MCKKDFEKIADEILCGVDYDIYKDDCNEMDNELRDEIEARLVHEFDCFDELVSMLERVTANYQEAASVAEHEGYETKYAQDKIFVDAILAKARGEHV